MNEKRFLKGEYILEVIDKTTNNCKIYTLNNALTYINRDIHLSLLLGTFSDVYNIDDLNIKYFAFGDNDTPATGAQTKLFNERFRKQFTVKHRPQGEDYVETLLSLGTADANFHIREIGVFAGPATAALNSGQMISRVVVDIEKFENKLINITRRDYISI